jgi:hypothetical protein
MLDGMTNSLFAGTNPLASVEGEKAHDRPGVRTRSTRDHDTIRRWATAHAAEPATGEATESGPATVAVNDGGVGVRFNFPGAARFRPIDWIEWLAHFDRHQFRFVFEEPNTDQVAARAYELFHERGSQPGGDREDWFHAERELQDRSGGASPSGWYRIVKDTTRA